MTDTQFLTRPVSAVSWTPQGNAQRNLHRQRNAWHEMVLCRGNRGNEILLVSADGDALQWIKPEQLIDETTEGCNSPG